MSFFDEFSKDFKVFLEPASFSDSRTKIAVIGCGLLGGTCLASLIYSNISANIVLIETDEKKFGQEKVLYESVAYCPSYNNSLHITYSPCISASIDSDICILCPDCTNLNHEMYNESSLFKSTIYFQQIVSHLIKYCPNAILISLTYPFNILNHLCYKFLTVPKNHIIGLGTALATSELQTILSRKFKVSPQEIGGFVIGMNTAGHKIPVWSTISVCGINLNYLVPLLGTDGDPENLYDDLNLTQTKYESLFKQKGPTRWALALFCARICNAIICDAREVFTVTANIKGMHGIKKEFYVGIPCTIGRNGIHSIINLHLNTREIADLKNLSDIITNNSEVITNYLKQNDIIIKKKSN